MAIHELLLAPGTCENLISKEVTIHAWTKLVTDWPMDCFQSTSAKNKNCLEESFPPLAVDC